MKIAFHYHIPAIRKDDSFYLPAFFGMFLDSIANNFDHIECLFHRPSNSDLHMMDYKIKSQNIKLTQLSLKKSIPLRYLNFFLFDYLRFLKIKKKSDYIIVRASTPLLPLINLVFKNKIILMLVSDAVSGIENLTQPFIRKKLILLWAKWYQKTEDLIAKKSITIVNSQMIYDKHKHKVQKLKLIKTSTLTINDIYSREDTCQKDEIRLIYSGRITKIKGIYDILHAVRDLNKEGYKIKFILVGMIDSAFLKELNDFLSHNLMSNYCKYIGYKTAGSSLLNEYRKSDIFIIASQSDSEGFPRSIWEAMASSCPVIATKVSSIPQFGKGAIELCNPKDIQSIKKSLQNVINNKSRRAEMIKKGKKLAAENTLDKRALELYEFIKSEINLR